MSIIHQIAVSFAFSLTAVGSGTVSIKYVKCHERCHCCRLRLSCLISVYFFLQLCCKLISKMQNSCCPKLVYEVLCFCSRSQHVKMRAVILQLLKLVIWWHRWTWYNTALYIYQLFDAVEHDVGWVVLRSAVVTLCLDFSFLICLSMNSGI